jgi:CelD/BcsL family acetyltransferase involved in cellulose biosynthesis
LVATPRGSGLWTLAAHDGGALAGAAPFFIHTGEDGRRQVTLLGNGISDSCDMLIDAAASQAASLLLGHLAAHADAWDCCGFRDLPATSMLRSHMPDRLGSTTEEDTPCLVLDLTRARPDLVGIVPAAVLRKLRQGQRRAKARGGIRIDMADAQTLESWLTALFALHALRWAERGEAGVLGASEVEAFHRDVADRLLHRGWLRLYRLHVGDELAGLPYGFQLRDRFCSYIGGFNPRFNACSPGALLIEHAISEAVRAGACEFDFLRGAEACKYRWGARDRVQYRVRIDGPRSARPAGLGTGQVGRTEPARQFT